MAHDYDPIPQQWYENLDMDNRFQVTAVDEDAGTIEIQYFDGDLEEIDQESWVALNIERIEAPEDWTGPVDNIEIDELQANDFDMPEGR